MELAYDSQITLILDHFELSGTVNEIKPFGSGHIHDTYLVSMDNQNVISKYILQKVNHQVFTEAEMVCDNIHIVCEFIYNQLKARDVEDIDRRCMRVVLDKSGNSYFKDERNDFWRVFTFIDNTDAVDEVTHTSQAYEAAKAIGEFQWSLSGLEADKIGESIPNFHHIGWRYDNLDKAIQEDRVGRAKNLSAEITFAEEMKSLKREMLALLDSEKLPIRIVHNDTKINNVLLDKKTGKAICVIDLDTVMPGSIIYDFGDMVRTFTSPSPEDEADLSKVYLRLDIYESLVKGYLEKAQLFIEPIEKANLILGAKLITLIMGIRFLTDYLNGDVYYKIHYPDQNLKRCQNQFKLVRDIISKEAEMQTIINRY